MSPILDNIHKYQNNLRQHVKQMSRSRKARTLLDCQPSGKISLDRPMRKWWNIFVDHKCSYKSADDDNDNNYDYDDDSDNDNNNNDNNNNNNNVGTEKVVA